jgi:hypothetical protein
MRKLVFHIVCGGLLASLVSSIGPASAEPIFFMGEDPGAGPGQPRPNADAAAAAFDMALGIVSVIDFESVPLGDFTSLMIAPGVTLTKPTMGGGSGIVSTRLTFSSSTEGYNTTLGGEQFVRFQSISLTFGFQQPIQAFGAYVIGAQPGSWTPLLLGMVLANGTSQVMPITTSPAGGVLFIGFADTGESFREVTLFSPTTYIPRFRVLVPDSFSVDDVRFGIPEPSTFVLAGLGVVALLDYRWRQRKLARCFQTE